MKRTLPLWSLCFLFCIANAHAELYKLVGPDGKITYSDTPPPASTARIEKKLSVAGGGGGMGLPYELSEIVKNNPVTLYTGSKCTPCNEGRKLLNNRGIPFTEKTVNTNEDIAQLRKAGGDTQLPLLVVARNTQHGFETEGWNTALTAAGYPETSKLPGNYRNPLAEPAAPVTPVTKSVTEKQANDNKEIIRQGPADLPPAIGNAPPGFRF